MTSSFVLLIVVFILNPFHFFHIGQVIEDASNISLKYDYGIKRINYYIFLYLYQIGIGKMVFVASILGVLVSFKKHLFSSIFLFTLLVPFFYVFAYYSNGGYFPRNFLTIIPILLIFSAIFIYEITVFVFNIFKLRTKYLLPTLILVGLLMSFHQLKNSIISTSAYTKPWGFKIAQKWFNLNLPNDSVLIIHQWDKYPVDKVSRVIPPDPSSNISEMREIGAQYAYLNLDWLVIRNVWWINSINVNLKTFSNMAKVYQVVGNSYSAIAIKELASWSVASFVKPWQAPDMNTLIVKIPEEPIIEEKKLIESYNFNNLEDFSKWNLIDGNNESAELIKFSEDEGKNQKGSLMIKNGIRNVDVIVAFSPIIKIDDKHAYVIEGWIKPERKQDEKEKDGVLRVDFFKEKPENIDIYTKSDYQVISSRVFGVSEWILKKVLVVPPEGNEYMSVGFQTSGELNFWLDDIKVYESNNKFNDPRKQFPYIDYRIPDEILIPSTAEF